MLLLLFFFFFPIFLCIQDWITGSWAHSFLLLTVLTESLRCIFGSGDFSYDNRVIFFFSGIKTGRIGCLGILTRRQRQSLELISTSSCRRSVHLSLSLPWVFPEASSQRGTPGTSSGGLPSPGRSLCLSSSDHRSPLKRGPSCCLSYNCFVCFQASLLFFFFLGV